jgi:hypothetical protein
MKKFFIIGCLMVASVAKADVLSWRVFVASGNSFYTSAQLFSTSSGTINYLTQTAQSGSISKQSDLNGVLPTDTVLTVSGSSYSFFITLFNGGAFAGYSELMSWDDLLSVGSIWSGTPPALPGTTYWNAVPEPTSMGLLALGMSALLLRRRRRV